jgi:hypothetical protein
MAKQKVSSGDTAFRVMDGGTTAIAHEGEIYPVNGGVAMLPGAAAWVREMVENGQIALEATQQGGAQEKFDLGKEEK